MLVILAHLLKESLGWKSHISFYTFDFSQMPPKKDVGKKTASSGKKPVVDKKASSSNENKPAAKPEKISFSFTASANLNDGGETAGNVPYLWVSKASMIRCALTYGDVVIVQSMKEGSRILASRCIS